MSQKELFITGRAEYLAEYEGCSLSIASKIATQEWKNAFNEYDNDNFIKDNMDNNSFAHVKSFCGYY